MQDNSDTHTVNPASSSMDPSTHLGPRLLEPVTMTGAAVPHGGPMMKDFRLQPTAVQVAQQGSDFIGGGGLDWHPSDPLPGRKAPAPSPVDPSMARVGGLGEPDWHPSGKPVTQTFDVTPGLADIPAEAPTGEALLHTAAQVVAGDVPPAPDDEDPFAPTPV